MNVFVQLIAVSRKDIAEPQLNRPVPPGVKTLVSVAKIRFGLVDDASERFEYFALCFHRAFHLGLPWQAEVLEHGNAHTFEAAAVEGLCKLSARLVDGDWRVLIEAGQHAQKKCAVTHAASHRPRHRQCEPA